MLYSEILFNEAGRSIESPCMVFKGKKWHKIYLLCSQPNDVCNIVLFIHKNRRERTKMNSLAILTLDSLVGLETNFELRKQRHTFCLITAIGCSIFSFSSMEHLLLWESWINQACSRGSMFYMQLVCAPECSRAHKYLHHEVRLHIHDGRLAIVEGHPQKLIGYWFLKNIVRIGFISNTLHFFAHDRSGIDDGMYSLVSAQIKHLEEHINMAKRPGVLPAYINRISGYGHWCDTDFLASKRSLLFHHSSAMNDLCLTDEEDKKKLDELARECKKCNDAPSVSILTPLNEQDTVPDDPRLVESSSPRILAKFDNTVRPTQSLYENFHLYENLSQNYTRNNGFEYKLDVHRYRSAPILKRFTVPEYMNVLPEERNVNSQDIFNGNHNETAYLGTSRNIEEIDNSNSHLKPNIFRADSWPNNQNENLKFTIGGTDMQSDLVQKNSEYKAKYTKLESRASRSRTFNGSAIRGLRSSRSRSVGGDAIMRRPSNNREENWDRAKRIIGSIRRSTSDLKASGSRLSMSLDRIATLSNGSTSVKSHRSSLVIENSELQQAENSPKLHALQNSDFQHEAVIGSCSTVQSSIAGLVKVEPGKIGLTRERMLSKNLQQSITGSYSKYDGEKTTHHYNPESNKNIPLIVDCLESAVKKGRERLIEADRRNSDIAFRSRMNSYVHRRFNPYTQAASSTMENPNSIIVEVIHERMGSQDEADNKSCDSKTSSALSNTCKSTDSKNVKPDNQFNDQPTSPADIPPPLPPKTYLKKKVYDEMENASTSVQNVANGPSRPERRSKTFSAGQTLTGNYCALLNHSTNSSRKQSQDDRIVYLSIDPVATVAAFKAQTTVMEDRERHAKMHGSALKKNRYFSEILLNGRKKSRQSTDESSNPPSTTKGLFSRRFWKKPPSLSLSHTDLRFA